MQELKPAKEGKVREVYEDGGYIIMVATDRISAFDVILKNVVHDKGTILTQMSKFWFDFTKDIIKNHMISVDDRDMPEFFQKEEYRGKVMKCQKLSMLPIECIVRGYITGTGWESYQKNGKVCGATAFNVRTGEFSIVKAKAVMVSTLGVLEQHIAFCPKILFGTFMAISTWVVSAR